MAKTQDWAQGWEEGFTAAVALMAGHSRGHEFYVEGRDDWLKARVQPEQPGRQGRGQAADAVTEWNARK